MVRAAVTDRESIASALLRDEDEDQDVKDGAVTSVGCAREVARELESLLALLRVGFLGRRPEEGPISETEIALQQGKLATAIFAERTRQQKVEGDSLHASQLRHLRQAVTAQGHLFAAIKRAPLRLFRPNDAKLKTLLWGVERSSAFLQRSLQPNGHDATESSAAPSESESDSDLAEEASAIEYYSRADKDANYVRALNTPVTDRLVHMAQAIPDAC